jgi:hypothetical protein
VAGAPVIGKCLGFATIALAVLCVVSGCGTATETGDQAQRGGLPEVRVESPAVVEGGVSQAEFHCETDEAWLPLRWGPVPSGTAEIVVVTTRYTQSVVGHSAASTLNGVSLLDGVPPTAGEFSVSSSNAESIRYHQVGSVCPAENAKAKFFIQIFAMPANHPALETLEDMEILEMLFKYALGRGELDVAYS